MAAIAVALGAAYWYGVDRPLARRLSTARDEMNALRAGRASRAATDAERHELDDRLRQAELALTDFESRIPRSADLGRFIEDVSDIAGRAGLRDQHIEPHPPESRGLFVVLPIRMDFASGFEGAFAFLRGLEELHRVARVSELKVARPEPFEGLLRAELTIQIFYQAA